MHIYIYVCVFVWCYHFFDCLRRRFACCWPWRKLEAQRCRPEVSRAVEHVLWHVWKSWAEKMFVLLQHAKTNPFSQACTVPCSLMRMLVSSLLLSLTTCYRQKGRILYGPSYYKKLLWSPLGLQRVRKTPRACDDPSHVDHSLLLSLTWNEKKWLGHNSLKSWSQTRETGNKNTVPSSKLIVPICSHLNG